MKRLGKYLLRAMIAFIVAVVVGKYMSYRALVKTNEILEQDIQYVSNLDEAALENFFDDIDFRGPILIDIENAVKNKDLMSASVLRSASDNISNDGSRNVLINLRWDRKNDPAQTKKMLQMYSSRLANEISKHKNVSEIVIFWQVPYHLEDSNIAKFNYSRKNNEMTVGAEWFAPVIR